MNKELWKGQELVKDMKGCLEGEVRIIKVKATVFILDSSIQSCKLMFFLTHVENAYT
jgi:hypothetical protein